MSKPGGLQPADIAKSLLDEVLYGGTDQAVSGPPYIRDGINIQRFLAMPIITSIPLILGAIYFFGWQVMAVIITALVAGAVVEGAFSILRNRPPAGGLLVVVVLFSLLLPPGIPLYIVALGAALAILSKEIFGGLGFYLFNPALVGKAILIIAFPVMMTNQWAMPHEGGLAGFAQANASTETVAAANTPLANQIAAENISQVVANIAVVFHFVPLDSSVADDEIRTAVESDVANYEMSNLLVGNAPGAMGTTSGILLLLIGGFLLATRAVNWRIPVLIIATVVVGQALFEMIFSDLFRGGPVTHILTGGLLFTAFLVASDAVTSPITLRGKMIYGVIIGILIVVMRIHLPIVTMIDPQTEAIVGYQALTPDIEGVTFSVLLANALVPFIDRITKPRSFGGAR